MQEDEARPAQGQAASRGRIIMRGIGSLTTQSILNAILGFVLLATFLRFLAQSDYGTYASVAVTVGIAGAVAAFGLPAAVVRFLAPSSSQDGLGWGPAKAALYLNVLLSAAVSLAVVALAPYLSVYFIKGSSGAWVFYFGAAWLFTNSLAVSFQALLQGMRKYSSLAKILLGSRFVAVAFAVAGLAVYHNLAVAIASWVVYFLLIVFGILPVVLGPLKRADPRPYYRSVIRYAYFIGLAGVVGSVAGSADIVVVGGYLSVGSLGVYSAAITISSVLSAFFVVPLVTALFAEASLSSESEQELRTGTSLAIRFSMVTLLPASFFAAAVAPQLFDLFSGGGTYAQGIPYLELITLFYVFASISTIGVSILQGVSGTRQVLAVGAVTAVGEVVLAVALVPGLGLAGAAYSRVAMSVVGGALSLYFIRRYLPNPVDFAFYAKALLASAVPALGVYIPSVILSDRVLTLFPYAALGGGLYIVCLKLLRLLTPQDKTYLLHLLPASAQWVVRLL